MNGPDALDIVLMLAAALVILAVFLGIYLTLAQAGRRSRGMLAVAGMDGAPYNIPMMEIPDPPNTFGDCASGSDGGCGGD